MEEVTLRPVTNADSSFLRRVYAGTRAQELTQTDWSAEQKTMFCNMQFDAQTKDYRKNYPEAEYCVIERAGVPAGRLYVERSEKELLILDIALLPEHCGLGIGTHFLRELQREAAASGQVVTLHVERFNPALRLYQRLGFQEVEDKGIYYMMQWRASR
jgi:ribosomal protein S18 acetylase RimI-like enzyme